MANNPTQAQIDKLTVNSDRWDQVINGGPTETVALDSATVKTLQGYLEELKSYNILGAWVTATAYIIKDVIAENNLAYVCILPHTSGVFATDLAAGKWALYQIDFTSPLDLYDDLLVQGVVKVGIAGNYNKVTIARDSLPVAPYNGGTIIAPETIPGSGVAYYLTRFKSLLGAGSTEHVMSVDGRLGVGTNTTLPVNKLMVSDLGADTLLLHRDVDVISGGAASSRLEFSVRNGSVVEKRSRISGVGLNPTGGRLYFWTADETNTLVERMRIDQFGNVGIGKPNPLSALDVVGNIRTLSTNGIRLIEVSHIDDFPAPSGLIITLQSNTTYVIKGTVDMGAYTLRVNSSQGVTIKGSNPSEDILSFKTQSTSGVYYNEGIAITDSTVLIDSIGFTHQAGTYSTAVFITAYNYTDGDYNQGREEFLTISNCHFIDFLGLGDIAGFDLVQFSNCLFQYGRGLAGVTGVKFYSVSKLQISSCEFIRWFDKSTLPAPSGYATGSMMVIGSNNGRPLIPTNNSPGCGAVNISGCVLHPQQTQGVLGFDATSSTAFGTISANTFVTVGLTTGAIFNRDYNAPEFINYDVKANQGVLDSTAIGFSSFSGNTSNTQLTRDVAVPIGANGLATPKTAQRFSTTTEMELTYTGIKSIFATVTAAITCEKQGGGSAIYDAFLYRDTGSGYVVLADSQARTATDAGWEFTLNLSYALEISQGDSFKVYIMNSSDNDDVSVEAGSMIIKE